MSKAFKRFRIKRGPGTWDNVVQTNSGTKVSRSNKTHNTTTNVSRSKITTHQNNGGWMIRRSRPMHPKTQSSSKSKTYKSTGKTLMELLFSKKKSKPKPASTKFDSNQLIDKLEKIDNKLKPMDDAVNGNPLGFIIVVGIVCAVIQCSMR